MQKVTQATFERAVAAYLAAAQQVPLRVLATDGQDCVLVSASDYARLKKLAADDLIAQYQDALDYLADQ